MGTRSSSVCPICAREAPPRAAGNPAFPFCSAACKLVDLGRWLDGAYRIPGPPGEVEGGAAEGMDEGDRADDHRTSRSSTEEDE